MRGSKEKNLMISTSTSSSSCFSSILRRLACSGSLASPTLSDHQRHNHILPGFNSNGCIHPDPNVVPKSEPTSSNSDFLDRDNPAQPGLVARLMGLESMPSGSDITCSKDLVMNLRSKSLNSLHWYIFPDTFLDHVNPSPCHRRTQTSSSVLCVEPSPSKDKLEPYSCIVEDNVVRKPEKRRRNGELSKWKKVDQNERNASKKNDKCKASGDHSTRKRFIQKAESTHSRKENKWHDGKRREIIKYKDFGTKLRKDKRDALKLKVDEKRTRNRVSVFDHRNDSSKDESARRRRRSSRKNLTSLQGEMSCRRTRKETGDCSEWKAQMSRLTEEYVRGDEWNDFDENVKELGVGFAGEMLEVLINQFLDELIGEV